MNHSDRLGCVVLAAGNAQRFGTNKLTAQFQGRSLIRRALEAVPPDTFSRVVVVTQYPEVQKLAEAFGFAVLENTQPERGISHTVSLGLSALTDCDGVLFSVSDQPLLRRETVAALVQLWRQHPDCIAALGHGETRGNPCLFPAEFFPELLSLEGDRGGNQVIRRHAERLVLLETNPRELYDVDTVQALDALAQN